MLRSTVKRIKKNTTMLSSDIPREASWLDANNGYVGTFLSRRLFTLVRGASEHIFTE